MLVLRCDDCASGVKYNDSSKKTYRIWFDLDARRKCFITVFEDDKYEDILNRINNIRGTWLETCGDIK